MDQNTRQIRKGGPPCICQGLRRRQHRTEHKGHTPNPRIGIKIPDPARNRTPVAGLEGNATSTDFLTFLIVENKVCVPINSKIIII